MIFKNEAMELPYEDCGRGPAVVVLHDRPSNRELRDSHFQALAASGYRVIIVNADGLGTRPSPTTAPAPPSERILALLNYLGIGRAVLIGIGQGGWVTLDLMERFPARVAGASFVVSCSLAAELRRRAASQEALEALRRGQCNPLKQVFLAAGARAPVPRQLPRLRAWINRLRERRETTRRPAGGNPGLAGFSLPALLVEEESGIAHSQEPKPLRNKQPRKILSSLSGPLQVLFNALLPPADVFEQKAEEDLIDLR